MIGLVFGIAGGIAVFGWGFGLWHRMRLIADTPTAKIRSMPMGRVELYGRVQEKAELLSPVTKHPCVYYRYQVEEEDPSDEDDTWVTVDRGDSSAWGFYLNDDTGSVLVMPEGARIEIGLDFQAQVGGLSGWFSRRDPSFDPNPWVTPGLFGLGRKLRFREWRIHAGEFVYLLGVSQERPGIGGEQRQRVLDKLRALKADPEAMAHFDTDGDGHVSSAEWQVARRLTVRETHRSPSEDRVVVAADPAGGAPFLISDHGEDALVASYRWKCVLAVFGGIAVSVASFWFLLVELGVTGPASPR